MALAVIRGQDASLEGINPSGFEANDSKTG